MSDSHPLGAAAPPPLLNDDDPALFPKLTYAQVDLLSAHGKVRPIEAGDVLFRDGDETYDAMVLLEGRLAVLVGDGDARWQPDKPPRTIR